MCHLLLALLVVVRARRGAQVLTNSMQTRQCHRGGVGWGLHQRLQHVVVAQSGVLAKKAVAVILELLAWETPSRQGYSPDELST